MANNRFNEQQCVPMRTDFANTNPSMQNSSKEEQQHLLNQRPSSSQAPSDPLYHTQNNFSSQMKFDSLIGGAANSAGNASKIGQDQNRSGAGSQLEKADNTPSK